MATMTRRPQRALARKGRGEEVMMWRSARPLRRKRRATKEVRLESMRAYLATRDLNGI